MPRAPREEGEQRVSDKKEKHGEVKKSAHKIWLAGLGALAVAEEEGSKLFKQLVERGKGFEGRAAGGVEKVKDKAKRAKEKAERTWERLEEGFDQRLTSRLQRIGLPTRKEIEALAKQVEKLGARLERLAKGSTGRTPTRKKATTRSKKRKAASRRRS